MEEKASGFYFSMYMYRNAYVCNSVNEVAA